MPLNSFLGQNPLLQRRKVGVTGGPLAPAGNPAQSAADTISGAGQPGPTSNVGMIPPPPVSTTPGFHDYVNSLGATDENPDRIKKDYLNLYPKQQPTISGLLSGQKFSLPGRGLMGDKDIEKIVQQNNYDAAEKSLAPAEQADVAEYQRTSPMAQRKLIGQLNARGLGSSLMAGGSGSGAYSELLNRQASGLAGIQSGYQGLQNSLEQQLASGKIDTNQYYQQLGAQRAMAKQLQQQNSFGLDDIFGLAPGVISVASKL